MQEATPLVYRTKQLTVMLDTTPRTLQRWVKAGHLPAPFMPGRWSKPVMDEWLESKSRQTATLKDISLLEGI